MYYRGNQENSQNSVQEKTLGTEVIGATMKKDSAVFHQKAGDIQKKRNAGICTLYSRAVL
jgi:hypothetical protein